MLPLLQAAYKSPSARALAIRRALAITDFDFDIKYEPGATHFLPDYLSRVHHGDTPKGEYEPDEGCKLFAINEEDTELTMETIMQEQLKDGELSQVMKYLVEGDLPTDGDKALHVMNLSDHTALLPPGVLYRCANKTNKKQKYARLRKRTKKGISDRLWVDVGVSAWGLTKGHETTNRSATLPLRHFPLLEDISSPELDIDSYQDLLREQLFPGLEVALPELRPDEVQGVFQTLCLNTWDFEELIPWSNPTAWEGLEKMFPVAVFRARRVVDSGVGAVHPNCGRPQADPLQVGSYSWRSGGRSDTRAPLPEPPAAAPKGRERSIHTRGLLHNGHGLTSSQDGGGRRHYSHRLHSLI